MDLGRVTVFGGSGFIGRHLVRRLAAAGATVRIGVRDPEAALYLKPMGEVGQIVPVRADIRDAGAVAAAVAGADAVVNLVGILYQHGSQRFDAIHHIGAENVARAAADAGARRLVQLSAIGADSRSLAAYARSKAAGEAAAAAAFPGAVIVRPSVVFGPEDDFFNRFAAIARLTPVLPVFTTELPALEIDFPRPPRIDIYRSGGVKFQPVYVGDVADAAMRILAEPATAGTTYELGGPRVYSFKQLMELVLRQIGRRRLLMPLHLAVAEILAAPLGLLPVPPLTRDQVRLMRRDNVAAAGAPGLAELGVEPTAVEVILPTYVDRFRLHGRFGTASVA